MGRSPRIRARAAAAHSGSSENAAERQDMTETKTETNLVQTGIAGLDGILDGGIPRGNVILVEGGIGTGKTTLGVEFVYRGACDFDEPGLIILFEVSPDKLTRDAATLGWDLPELERQGKVRVIFTTREVFRQ